MQRSLTFVLHKAEALQLLRGLMVMASLLPRRDSCGDHDLPCSTGNSPRPLRQLMALPALMLTWMPLLQGRPALAAPIDLICSLPPASVGGLGTLVDLSLSEGSSRGSSFWPVSGERRSVLAQVAVGQIQILQPGSDVLLFTIDRLNGSITAPGGQHGRCTNTGHVRVDRAI